MARKNKWHGIPWENTRFAQPERKRKAASILYQRALLTAVFGYGYMHIAAIRSSGAPPRERVLAMANAITAASKAASEVIDRYRYSGPYSE